MRTAAAIAVIVILLFAVPHPATAQNAAACDRDCLRGFVDRYLNALAAHKPGDLPASPKLRFTEDTVEMKLGEGLWKTAGKLDPYRIDILDVRQGIAGTHAILEENGTRIMLVARLKVENRQITEVETQVTRNAAESAIFDINNLKTPSVAMTSMPDRAKLNTRADAQKIAEGYPAGLKAGSFVTADTQFASDAYRFEGGRQMAGPGCTFFADCENIKTQRIPRLAGLTYRVAAVDEEAGMVWLRLDFGPGSLMGANANQSLNVWEIFKVWGGQIHAVEAFMKVMPQNHPSGWDTPR
jgi:hypothetical protein